jgi:hypothetical protein
MYGHARKEITMVAARENLNEFSSIIHVPKLANLFCAYYITFHSKILICGFFKSKGKTNYLAFCKEFWFFA